MKKTILLVTLTTLLGASSYGREAKQDTTKSKTEALLSEPGKLLQRELFLIDKILASNYTIRVEAIIINDINASSRTGALQISTYSTVGPQLTTHVGTIDYDEIKPVIKTLEYIKTDVIDSSPEVSSKVEFLSGSGLKVGAHYDPYRKSWSVIFNPETDEPAACGSVPLDHLDEAISVFRQALEFIDERRPSTAGTKLSNSPQSPKSP
jgi:hypothetical protein